MRELRTLTFVYEPQEDRIFATVNVSGGDLWACWLTRRFTFALLEQALKVLASTSALARNSAAEFRPEIIAFEHQAAMVSTAGSMRTTSLESLKVNIAATERAKQLTISHLGARFRLELQGTTGESAAGLMSRADFQRILQMLEDEVCKAGWDNVRPVAPDAAATRASLPLTVVRH